MLGILTFFTGNGATTPSLSYKVTLEHQEKELSKGTTHDLL